MAFPWTVQQPQGQGGLDPYGGLQAPAGYSYPRSAQSSPYANQAVLLPTPPVAVSPLPGGQMWMPVYSPNTGAVTLPQPSPNMQARSLLPQQPQYQPQTPVLIDILHPSSRRTGAKGHHLIYDIRDFPEKAMVSTRPTYMGLSEQHIDAPLTNPPTTKLRVISKAFPWEIEVESQDETLPVTVGDLITTVHETMQKLISSSEWWIVTDSVREKVSAAYVKNCDRSSAGNPRRYEVEKPREKTEGLRRVDWLLDNVVMNGLERDDAFINTRVRDKDTRLITWCLVTTPKH